ncbi:MAG: sulfatase-like hydrolase/transferase [Nitrospiraceae bacterium]|nr:sulfatase-like hydrolase/transferase [Nitrospiraceae bacterium]
MAEPMNILYLFSDQHAAHALGCYGNQEVCTPHLDQLAAEGVLFENAFAQCGICAPSRMSIYTGCYPATLGARGNLCQYPDHLPPLIPHLRDAGYTTAAIGKMHFVPGRRCPGFDVMKVCRGGSAALPDDDWRAWLIEQDPAYEKLWPWGEGLSHFDANEDFERNRHLLTCGLPLEHYVDTWVTNQAVDYLKQPKGKPFFAWIGLTRPHDPYAPPPGYDRLYDPAALKLWPEPWGLIRANSSEHERWVKHRIDDFNPPYHGDYGSWLRDAVAAFYGQVTYVDHCVGRILRTLEDCGLAENTIVVYGADHGDFVGRYGMMGKLIPGNDALVRVPLIWRVPGMQADRTHPGLTENLDIFPTLFDLAGLPIPPQCEGVPLRPALSGDASFCKETVFFEDEKADGLRTAEWTYVRHHNGERELYDLCEDPCQESNLWLETPGHARGMELEKILDRHLSTVESSQR